MGALIKTPMRVGFDIDGVLADFKGGLIREAEYMDGVHEDFPTSPNTWVKWQPEGFIEVFDKVKDCPSFWLNLPVRREARYLLAREDSYIAPMIGASIVRYVTARPVAARVSEEWLVNEGFPEAEVIVAYDKTPHMEGLDYFVEDNFDNWYDINAMTETKCLLLRTVNNERLISTYDMRWQDLIFDSLYDGIKYLEGQLCTV